MTADLAEVVGRFGHLLHRAGVPVTPERSGRFARAIGLASPATTTELYWLARVTLLSAHDQIAVFDRVFAQVFGGLVDPVEARGQVEDAPPPQVRAGDPVARAVDTQQVSASSPRSPSVEGGQDDGSSERPAVLAAMSAQERLRSRDFAELDAWELARLHDLLDRLAVVAPRRRVRRHRVSPGGRRIDLRATLSRAHRTGGDAARIVRRRRRERPRPIVWLCDVSGSMEPYTRVYLHLLHGAVIAGRAEVFVFATRLTRLTRALRVRQPGVALRRAAALAPDWSGGTRIGRAIAEFLDRYGRRGMARGAVVVVLSDGWESEDPRLLAEQMERLRRLAHRIVWINPRSASPHYQPLVGGMAAALPHIDVVRSGHSLEALEAVLESLRG